MENYAPIVLFVYNRPKHTAATLEALLKNKLANKSDLYIYADFPKEGVMSGKVKEVREIVHSLNGFRNITIIEREENYGLVRSITEGVSYIVKKYGKVIVLEDDLIAHHQFLEFMNKALERYADEKTVYQITGYSHFFSANPTPANVTYFLKITSTWGWGTWRDRWVVMKNGLTGADVLDNDAKMKKQFNYDNSYNYYSMLNDSKRNKLKSWGIVWYWNLFKKNGLTLYPYDSLIDQIGFDGSGQNARNHHIAQTRIHPIYYDFSFPDNLSEDEVIRKRIVMLLKYRKFRIIIDFIWSRISTAFKAN